MSEPPVDESEADFSRLAVIFANIRSNQHQTCKHLRHILKVDAVLGDVCLSFGFVPFEPHDRSVNTMCMYVKVYKVLLEQLVDRPWGRCLTWHFRLDAGTVDDPDQIRRRPSSHVLQRDVLLRRGP